MIAFIAFGCIGLGIFAAVWVVAMAAKCMSRNAKR
jgi:hypothetical protein